MFKQSGPLDDWDEIVLTDRPVYITFDSDAMVKREVHEACRRLGEMMKRRNASARYVYLPTADDGSKIGLDDYLAAGHSADDLYALAGPSWPPLPSTADGVNDAQYFQTQAGYLHRKRSRDGEVVVPLTNFPARIVGDEVLDDGAGVPTRQYEVEATVAAQVRRVTVSARQFEGMTWTSELGATAVLTAGMGVRDHARAAIQTFSNEIRGVHRLHPHGMAKDWRTVDVPYRDRHYRSGR